MGGPSEKQKAVEAYKLMNEANSAANETKWLTNQNADGKPNFASPAGPSAPVPSLDVQAMGPTSTPSSFVLSFQQTDLAATPDSLSTMTKIADMIHSADHESKAAIYSASMLLKMTHLASTEAGREVNDKIAAGLFGENEGRATASNEDSSADDGSPEDRRPVDRIRRPVSYNRRMSLYPKMSVPAPVPDPWDLARMPRSSDDESSPSPAGPASPNLVEEQYQDMRAELTHDERVALLGQLFEALETKDAQRNLEDDHQEPAATNIEEDSPIVGREQSFVPADNVTSGQSAMSTAQPATNQSPATRRPAMTMRDLVVLVKQFLETSATHFDPSNGCCVFEFSKAVEIFGQDRFMREPGQSRDILRPGTAVFKHARKAGLSGGIFRWLQGIPDLSTEFKYPAGTILRTIEQMTAGGI